MDKLKLKTRIDCTIKCPKDWGNCKICTYKEGFFEYITGLTFKEFFLGIRWNEVAFVVIYPLISGLIWGRIGIILAVTSFIFFDKLFIVGGPWIIPEGYMNFREEIINKCSAGVEDCRICNNQYSHEFNFNYEKSLRWYEKIC